MKSYLKLAFKVLGRRKFFTFISLFGITLTLVVLVVASAVLENMFSPAKPESRFDRVLMIDRVQKSGPIGTETTNPGFGFIHDHVYTLPDVEAVAAYSEMEPIAIYRTHGRSDSKLKRTDATYWRILDFRFLAGRPFSDDEVKRGALVAVITDGLAKRIFEKASPIDQMIEIDGRSFRIIGVVPNVPMTRWAAYSEVWIPHSASKSSEYLHNFMGNYTAIVLAHSRSDFPRLKKEMESRVKAIPIDDPKNFDKIVANLNTRFEAFAEDATPGNHLGKPATNLMTSMLIGLALAGSKIRRFWAMPTRVAWPSPSASTVSARRSAAVASA